MKTIYEYRKGVTRELEGSTHTLPILFEYAWSMLRVCLEYAWSMPRVCLEYAYTHLIWEPAISVRARRTGSPLPTDQESAPYGLFRTLLLLVVMLVMGVGEVWGATVTYHIINLGRLDATTGQPTSTRTEALQFTVTGENVTVGSGIFDNYKSPLAKNWKYYRSNDVTYDSNTKGYTLGSPSLNFGDALTNGADVYVTYELDEAAFSTLGVFDGGIFRIKFPNDYYLKQTMYNTDVNTNPVKNPGPSESEFLWKFNIIDPYQITVQSQSKNADANCLNFFLCSSANGNFDDTRLKGTLSQAQSTKIWAFGMLNGGTSGTYRLVVTDGFNGSTVQGRDDFNHGYLNDNYVKSGVNKTTYHRYGGNSHNNCDLTFESFSVNYTFHIINNSGEEAMSYQTSSALKAGATITESMIPDILKSPAACNYSFYPTASDAAAGTNAITRLPIEDDVYVRYETSSSGIYLNGGVKYKLSVGGEHHLFAADATTINSAATSGANDTYKWTLHGGDPYQFTIKNVDNSQYITYDVSGGEAVPTLSGTGSNFFLHQSTDGKYELVVIDGNYPDSYYTLGYDGTLKLYSKTNHSLGDNEIQTVFTEILTAIINPLPTAKDLTYNGELQELVTAGICENGIVKYREGTEGDFTTAIPQKKDPGTYSVYYMSDGDEGYEDFIAKDPIIVTIAPAPVTVTAVDKTKVYGETDPELTATVTGLISGEPDITYTINRATGEDANSYDITPAGDAVQGNYAVSFVNGTLTINQKTIGITWGETTFSYNGAPHAPTATATGLVNSDVIGITVTGAQTNVGNYTATASALTGTKKGNYQLPSANTTTFSIVKAAISTSIVMTDWSYGDYNESINSPSLSYNPENVVVTYRYKVKGADDETYVTAVPTNVGIYTVQASIPGTDNSDAQILTKNFTISKKALNRDDSGTPANGITVTVSKVITNQGTAQETITYPVTVIHNVYGVPTTLTPYDAEHPENPYDYTLSGAQSVSGYVITVTARNENNVYTGNYTGFAINVYADPTFYLDGATWSPSGSEYAAVYLPLSDAVPNPVTDGSEIKAYIVRRVNPAMGTVTVSPVEYTTDDTTNPPTKENYIPKGVPVLLLSNNENLTGFTISPTTESTTDITAAAEYGNLLRIAPKDGVPVKDTEAYIFYEGEFVLAKEGTIKKDYFYFYNPNYQAQSEPGGGSAPAPRRSLQIVVQDTETGISRIVRDENREVQNAVWFSLDGRRLMGKPTQKGIYITNGKKVIIR